MRNEALDLSKKIDGTTLTFEVNCDKNGEISQGRYEGFCKIYEQLKVKERRKW